MKDLELRIYAEIVRHRRRLAVDRNDGWVCKCGEWKGRGQDAYHHHVAESVAEGLRGAIGEFVLAAMGPWVRDRENHDRDNKLQVANFAGFKAAVSRLEEVLSGCTCRPGMVGRWGCPLEGHDPSWEE